MLFTIEQNQSDGEKIQYQQEHQPENIKHSVFFGTVNLYKLNKISRVTLSSICIFRYISRIVFLLSFANSSSIRCVQEYVRACICLCTMFGILLVCRVYCIYCVRQCICVEYACTCMRKVFCFNYALILVFGFASIFYFHSFSFAAICFFLFTSFHFTFVG